MSNLTTIPAIDGFETTLAQSWNGAVGTVYVDSIPASTFPSGEKTYIVVNPGKTNMQVARVSAWTTGQFTVDSISVMKGSTSLAYSQQSHAVKSKVLISDNYQFWLDIQTAVNSKLDSTGGNPSSTFDLDLTGSAFRIRKDGSNMKFTDDNTPEVTLTTLASGGGADQKVAVTVSDTTTGTLDAKLTAGDGLKKTVINPGGAETLDLDIDLADTTVFVATSSGAGDSGKLALLNASGQIPSGFIPASVGYMGFGDGSAGDVTITTTVTLTADTYYNNLTITSPGILQPNGYRFFVKGTLSGNGKIQRNGGVGGAGSGTTGGTGATVLNAGTLNSESAGVDGGAGGVAANGVAGTAGTSVNPTYSTIAGSAGGAGGAGTGRTAGAGGAGGTSTRGALYNISTLLRYFDLIGPASFTINTTQYKTSSVGGGGGGGGGRSGGAGNGGGGGGSATNGGLIRCAINTINWTGTREAIGGVGGAGGNGTSNGGGGGGGAGGNGGVVFCAYRTNTSFGTETYTGGAGGAGGAPNGTGTIGSTGPSGNTGVAIKVAI